ncbi:MAG: hypothetical protein GY952_13930 [Rhodobacteraceae bacterium]|nr:hypothetical protein [Paracoccaceae bacterium]
MVAKTTAKDDVIKKDKGNKKSKEAAPPAEEANGDHAPGHNSGEITTETMHFFMNALERAEKKVDVAKKELKGVRAKMEVQGINLEVFDETLKQIEQDDATTYRRYALRKHYALLLGLPIGSQLDLLDPDEAMRNATDDDLIDRARSDGYRAGLKGLTPKDHCPHALETGAGGAWMKGWENGQAAIAAEMEQQKKREEEEAAGEEED